MPDTASFSADFGQRSITTLARNTQPLALTLTLVGAWNKVHGAERAPALCHRHPRRSEGKQRKAMEASASKEQKRQPS